MSWPHLQTLQLEKVSLTHLLSGTSHIRALAARTGMQAAAHTVPCLDLSMTQASPAWHVERACLLLFQAGALAQARTQPVQWARRSQARLKALSIEQLG